MIEQARRRLGLWALGVDDRGTSTAMANAPAPTYDEHGNIDLEWLLVVRYDPSRRCITLSWTKDGDLFRRSKRGAMAYPVDEAGDVLDGITSTMAMLANPTLF